MKLTHKMLTAKEACQSQVDIFKAEWPDGVEVTLQTLNRAVELQLDLDWFAEYFLKAQAWVEYKKVKVQVWVEYKKVKAQILWVALQIK